MSPPEDRDSFDPKVCAAPSITRRKNAEHFQRLLLGLTDAFRLFEQPEKSFSWWDYRMLGFQKNRGLRIDHILVSDALKATTTACVVDRTPQKQATQRPRTRGCHFGLSPLVKPLPQRLLRAPA